MQFSVIATNPPYQKHQDKRHPLWKKFIQKQLEIVEENGYILSINPCSWRKPKDPLLYDFKKRNLKYIEIHNQEDGKSVFEAGTRYDWFILQNKSYDGKTIVKNEQGDIEEINILRYPFIPHFHLNMFEQFFPVDGAKKCSIICTSTYHTQHPKKPISMSKYKDTRHIYPCIHATSSESNNIWYASDKDHLFSIKKVIFGIANPYKAFFDKHGEYGFTQNCFAIPVKNDIEGNELTKFVEGNIFRNIVESVKFSGFAFEYDVLRHLKEKFYSNNPNNP